MFSTQNSTNSGQSSNGPKKPSFQSRQRNGRRSVATPDSKRSNAIPSDRGSFISRRPAVVDRDGGIPRGVKPGGQMSPKETAQLLNKGNLANPHINPHLAMGLQLQSRSAQHFPNGPVVRIIPLGGVSEVGMNMTAIECGDDIVIIDTGFGFGGGEKFPGVDYIIPDVSYLEQNQHKIRGLVYTHAHLDHIGGAPYILPKLGSIPIFGMPLTLALLKNRLQEFELQDKFVAKVIDPTKNLKLGVFEFSFFHLNHSIPDVVGLFIRTPMGNITYCTDWKFDNTPFDGQISDYAKLAQIGEEGVRLLLTDSLGIMRPGYQMSEKVIGETIMKIFKDCQGRVIVTSFSTTISRLQFTVDACIRYNRKLALVGRSMINNFRTCFELGYIKVPNDLLIDLFDVAKLPPERICILSTGSQGEDLAALARMSRDEHDKIKLQGGDSVIFSSGAIPGNEDAVQDLMARLSRKGVEVYRNKDFDLHVSGHACHEDLKLLIALTKPDYLQPIHGDHFMLRRVGELGVSMGIPHEHNLIGENGRIVELRPDNVVLTEDVITDSYVLVDGTGVGAVSEAVLEERRQMSTQGSLILVVLVNKARKIIGGPEIISRGFVYTKNNGDILEEIREDIRGKFSQIVVDPNSKTYFTELRGSLKKITSDLIYAKTEKTPIIIPVVVQV